MPVSKRKMMRCGPIAVIPGSRGVTVHEEPIGKDLGRRERQLLLILITEPHRTFSKQELIEKMQGDGAAATLTTRGLDRAASKLRRELAYAGADDYVVNSWGVGYRLAVI